MLEDKNVSDSYFPLNSILMILKKNMKEFNSLYIISIEYIKFINLKK
jgi:hypothetical protein